MEALRNRLRVATPEPPPHFEEPERVLWSNLHGEFKLGEASSLAILIAALESHARARQCRQQIEIEGMTVIDRWKQVKVHPLCAVERDSRAAFLTGMRLLGLDAVEGKSK